MRGRAVEIARRVRRNSRGDVSGRHSLAELAGAAACLIAGGWLDPNDRGVCAEADRWRESLAAGGGHLAVAREQLAPADAPTRERWAAALERLRTRLPASTFTSWIEPLVAVGLSGERLTLAAPATHCAWVSRRYAAAIREAAEVGEVVLMSIAESETRR